MNVVNYKIYYIKNINMNVENIIKNNINLKYY